MAARGRAVVSGTAPKLQQPRDARGSGRRPSEPCRLLLAAQHRDPRGRQERQGLTDPRRASPNGSGPSGVCRRHGAPESCHRPAQQGADREIRNARFSTKITVGQCTARPRHVGRHHRSSAGDPQRGDQEERRVFALAPRRRRRGAAHADHPTTTKVHPACSEVRRPGAVHNVPAPGAARRLQEAWLEGAGLRNEDNRRAKRRAKLSQQRYQHSQPSNGFAERNAVRRQHDEASASQPREQRRQLKRINVPEGEFS